MPSSPTSFSWTTNDQLKIYGAHWPVEQPKAVLALVHGLGEHCHRYDRFAAFYQDQQIAVVGYDRRGHGQSEGKRGHTPSYEALLEEIEVLLEKTKTFYPDTPIILFGHSMGGNLVLNYLLGKADTRVKGCIASAPWIILGQAPSAFLVALGRITAKLYPSFTQPNGLDVRHISTVPEEVAAYQNDPLVHDKITSGTGISVMDAGEKLSNYRGSFPVPLLVYHGAADPIISVAGSRALVNQISSDIRYQEWPDLYHETHHEANWQEVLGVGVEWIREVI